MSINWVKLSSVAKTSSGGTPARGNRNYYGGNIAWIKSGELPDGEIYFSEETITEEGLQYSSAKLFPIDTLLIAMYGATVGKLGILTFPAATNQAVCAITPTNSLDKNYLFYWLLNIRNNLIKASFGGAQPNISQTVIQNLVVPLPLITKQRQIAARLRNQLAEVETACKALKLQQADIKGLAATALDQLYSYPNKKKIGNVAKVQSGYAFKSKDFITQGIKLLRNTNILPNKIYWDETAYLPSESFAQYSNYVINEGDVVLSLDRPIISTGIKVARISEKDIPALLVQRVGRFLIDKNRIDPDYLYFFLNTSFFKDAISGHEQSLGVPHISPTQVESVEIPLPNINEQKKIAAKALEVFKQTEIAKIATKESQKDIEYLSSRLLTQAFDPLSAQ